MRKKPIPAVKHAEPAIPQLAASDLDALLTFLPDFESPGFAFGQWSSPEGQFPYYTLSDRAGEFLRTLYRHHWIISFPWMEWEEGRRLYAQRATQLDDVDLETLRKLLTAHVRSDRFSEGHLAQVWESGHLLAILRRLQVIRKTMR